MVTYISGSLFASSAQTLVNTVNTVGVMGKGIAKTFKAIYPEMYADYRERCLRGELAPGHLLLHRTPHKWILNFPTKRHWRQPSRLEDIEAGLLTFRRTFTEQGVTSIAFPQLGCGHGGLDWESQVRPLMDHYLDPLPIEVTVHIASNGAIAPDDPEEGQIAAWLRNEPPAFPFAAFCQDLSALIAGGRAAGWNLGNVQGEWHVNIGAGQVAVHQGGLFDLWRSLRADGYLTPDQIESVLHIPAESFVELLASLPYVVRTGVARSLRNVRYDARLTCDLLDAPGARGVRILPSRIAESQRTLLPLAEEDGRPWIGSQTISQLALFSTN